MKYLKTMLLLLVISVVAIPAAPPDDNDGPPTEFVAHLKGRNEVPLTLSAARGELRLKTNQDDSSVHFVLTYEGLGTHVMFSHIHIGQPNVNGGVTVFFCDNGTPPHSPNACPENAGTVEGDFTADDVIGLPSQQLDPNDLSKVLRAIRAGKTYANVHIMTSPGGEIRGQITVVEKKHERRDEKEKGDRH